MPKSFSNIGAAMMARQDQKRAAEAANQQFMMSLFAPMKFKQIEAEKERKAKQQEAVYRYQQEETARKEERKMTMDRVKLEKEYDFYKALMQEEADYYKELLKQSGEDKDDKFSPTESTNIGNTVTKLSTIDKADEANYQAFADIQHFRSLTDDEKKKISIDAPGIGILKGIWDDRKKGWPVITGDEEELSFKDYANAIGLSQDEVSKAIIAKNKKELGRDIISSLPGLSSQKEKDVAPRIAEQLSALTNLESQQVASGDTTMTYQDYINSQLREMWGGGQSGGGSGSGMSREDKIKSLLGE